MCRRRRRQPIRACGRQCAFQFRGIGHDPHPLAASPGRRLHKHRIADLVGRVDQVGVGHRGPRDSGDHRDAVAGDGGLCRDLVAHRLDRRGRRPDERDACRVQGGGELRILREESVSGVDGLGTGASRSLDDGFDVQVALPGGRGPDAHGHIGLCDVTRAGVGVAVHGHRSDAHPVQGSDHPDRDLAAVRNQHSVKRHAVTSGTRRRRPTRPVPGPRPKAQDRARFWCRRDR